MTDQNGGDRRRTPLAVIVAAGIAIVGWGAAGLTPWGGTAKAVDGHEDRIKRIEDSYVRERDLAAVSLEINRRLGRMETQLDQLLNRSMRPPP